MTQSKALARIARKQSNNEAAVLVKDLAREKSGYVRPSRSASKLSSAERAVLIIIVATMVVRILFASSLGLGIDESYTVATGRHLQLSYFDHPPLAWWLAWAGRSSVRSGNSSRAARSVHRTVRPDHLADVYPDEVALWREGGSLGCRDAQFCARNCLDERNLDLTRWSPQRSPVGGYVLRSGCAVYPRVGSATLVAGRGSMRWAGDDGETARHLSVCGHLPYSCSRAVTHRHWLATPWPYLAVAVAAAIFMPAIIWNAQHGWVSFVFQAERANPRGFAPWAPLVTLAGQALFLLPWVWLPLILCLVRAGLAGPAQERQWLLACLAIGPIVVFTVVAWTGTRTLPHWAAPGYLMLFPLLGRQVAEGLETGRRHTRTWLSGTAVSMALVLGVVITLAYVPWPPLSLLKGVPVEDPLLATLDWNSLEGDLQARHLLGRPSLFIAATRWDDAAKIDYALHGKMPVLCLARDPRGYGILTRPKAHIGQDALIIGQSLRTPDIEKIYGKYFKSLEELPSIAILQGRAPRIKSIGLFGSRLARCSKWAKSPRPNSTRPLSMWRAATNQKDALRLEQALSQPRFLYGDHAEGAWISHGDVHGGVRHRPDGGLDCTMERDDRRSLAAHRQAAPALYWRHPAHLHTDGTTPMKPSGVQSAVGQVADTRAVRQ